MQKEYFTANTKEQDTAEIKNTVKDLKQSL